MESNLEAAQKALHKQQVINTFISIPGTLALALAIVTLLTRGEAEPFFPILENLTVVYLLLGYGVISAIWTSYGLIKIAIKRSKLQQSQTI